MYEQKGRITTNSLKKFIKALRLQKDSYVKLLRRVESGPVTYDELRHTFSKNWLNPTLHRLQSLGRLEMNGGSYSLTPTGLEFLRSERSFRMEFGKPMINYLKKLSNAEVSWVRVRNIRKIRKKHEWVYDFTVENYHNFIANGIGII